MAFALRDRALLRDHLWKHQWRAVQFVVQYLNTSTRRPKAALLRLPTGTGKTGIMAVAANYIRDLGDVLIVAPAEYLTEQICTHLNEKFWAAAKLDPRHRKEARSFVPSTLGRELEKAVEPHIFVCTPQTLSMLHANEEDETRPEWMEWYAALRRRVKLVIVDEGHREPAKYWARAVRSFKSPTLLFSATPYRNDFRFFNLGLTEPFLFEYKFHDAVKDKVIRDVELVPAKEPFRGKPAVFARLLRAFYYDDPRMRRVGRVEKKRPRVIVRCADAASVKNVVDALLQAGEPPENVVGVHDTFDRAADSYLLPKVPTPDTHPAVFWVHQFKLTEGVDDPSFRVVAFYQAYGNARSLVQQVGRVLRNPGGRRGQKAYVLFDERQKLAEQWSGYRSFEYAEGALLSPEQVVQRFMKVLPSWFYVDGEYREPVGYEPDDVEEQVRVVRTAEVFRLPPVFNLTRLVDDTADQMEESEIIEVVREPEEIRGADFVLLLAWRVAQTDLLANDGFFEVSLVPAMFYRTGGYLFYQGPTSLRETRDYDQLSLVSTAEMERLLSGDKATVTQVSLINCDLGKNSVRRRSMGARAVGDLAPGLSDHFHYVSTAGALVGPADARVSRYVGLSRGRVSEDLGRRVTLAEFRQWCDHIASTLLNASTPAPPVLRRYAQAVGAPDEARARHMLIDLHELLQNFPEKHPAGPAFRAAYPDRFEATACDVGRDGTFECEVAKHKVTGRVVYLPVKKRFEIVSSDLDAYFPEPVSSRRRIRTPAAFLGARPVIRIVTEEGQLYTDRRFYEPRIPLWGANRLEHLGALIALDALAGISEAEKEKGAPGSTCKKTWPDGSIFELIDHKPVGLLRAADWPNLDYLICEDMGTETADFVAVDQRNRRLALLHAKYDGSKSGASAFQIVSAQATKNLEFFNPTGNFVPDQTARWSAKWQNQLPRIRPRFGGRVQNIVQDIDDLLRSSDVQKEVWIILGRGFSKSGLLTQLAADNPPYHMIQLAYLLQACNANASSVGARLKVFTSP